MSFVCTNETKWNTCFAYFGSTSNGQVPCTFRFPSSFRAQQHHHHHHRRRRHHHQQSRQFKDLIVIDILCSHIILFYYYILFSITIYHDLTLKSAMYILEQCMLYLNRLVDSTQLTCHSIANDLNQFVVWTGGFFLSFVIHFWFGFVRLLFFCYVIQQRLVSTFFFYYSIRSRP